MKDWERKRKYFGNIPADIAQHTFKDTTQLVVLSPSSHLQRQFKSLNLALKLHQQIEADSTDQIFSNIPALDGGKTSAHIFVRQDSKSLMYINLKTTMEQHFWVNSKIKFELEEFLPN